MEQPTGRQGNSSQFLQVLILVALGVVIYFQLRVLLRMRELGGEDVGRQFEAEMAAPIPRFGSPAKIVSIDPESRTLTVEQRHGSRQRVKRMVKIDEKTMVMVAGKPAQFNDLKAGRNVRLLDSAMDEDGVLHPRQITAEPPVQ